MMYLDTLAEKKCATKTACLYCQQPPPLHLGLPLDVASLQALPACSTLLSACKRELCCSLRCARAILAADSYLQICPRSVFRGWEESRDGCFQLRPKLEARLASLIAYQNTTTVFIACGYPRKSRSYVILEFSPRVHRMYCS